MSDMSIKKATFINFITRYSNIIIQLGINAVLARILTASDYGIIAVINVFIVFFTMLADMGIGPAIIQNKSLDEKDISNIFKFTLITGLIISILFIIFSYPMSLFYDNKIYVKLCAILSLAIFFSVINIVPNAIILKNKQFKLLAYRTIIINVVVGIVTIVLAFNDFKYYALIINSILIALFTFIFNYKSSKIVIVKGYSNESIVKIKNYSSYQFGFSFINYFSRNLDNLLIGKVMGDVALGYYEKSYKLMLYPVQNLTNVISPVLHPILSEYQDNKYYIYEKYIRVVRILSVLGLYFGVMCFFISTEVILILFGENWESSIRAFQILSLSIWPQVVTSSSGTIFQSTGETKSLFRNGLITTGINITLLVISLFYKKIEYVAAAVVISYWSSFFVTYFRLNRGIFKKSFLGFLSMFKNHIIIAILMTIGMNLIKINIRNNLLSMIVKCSIGLIIYLIGMIITKEYKNFNFKRGRK